MNQTKKVKFGRCDFCRKQAVVQFSRQSHYSSRGHRRAMTLHYRSCAEHESSPAWQSIILLYEEAARKRVRDAQPPLGRPDAVLILPA